MFESIPLGAILDGSSTVIVVVIVGLMIYKGVLVPRPFYRDVVEQRDLYQKAAELSKDQVTLLIEKADLQTKLLIDIQELAEQRRKEESE